MKLYLTPGTCALASDIALREAGLSFEAVKIDLRAKKTETGDDYLKVNPKGYVPALVLDNGETLTENIAILQYIADRKPEKNLAPAPTSAERIRLVEWLAFVSTEVHKNFSILFNPATPEEFKNAIRERIRTRLGYLEGALGQKQYLMGDTFTVADAYLYTVLRWSKMNNIDLDAFPTVKGYFERVGSRPAVKEALKAEGLE